MRAALPADARLTASAKWHITLVFLGDVDRLRPAPGSPAVTSAVAEVAAILARVPVDGSFSLHLAGGGRFGSAAWAAVQGDVSDLSRFRERVRSALDDGGFPSDPRPYQPHLTVTYRASSVVTSALDGFISPSWTVDEFALVESANGVYTTLQAWSL